MGIWVSSATLEVVGRRIDSVGRTGFGVALILILLLLLIPDTATEARIVFLRCYKRKKRIVVDGG